MRNLQLPKAYKWRVIGHSDTSPVEEGSVGKFGTNAQRQNIRAYGMATTFNFGIPGDVGSKPSLAAKRLGSLGGLERQVYGFNRKMTSTLVNLDMRLKAQDRMTNTSRY